MHNMTLFKLFGAILALGLAGCSGLSSKTEIECPIATKAEWKKSMKYPRGLIEGYGSVFETETKLERKSNSREGKSCKMERIWCPAPHSDKGCQVFKCDIPSDADDYFKVTDHNGERYFKTELDGMVRYNGSTFVCAAK